MNSVCWCLLEQGPSVCGKMVRASLAGYLLWAFLWVFLSRHRESLGLEATNRPLGLGASCGSLSQPGHIHLLCHDFICQFPQTTPHTHTRTQCLWVGKDSFWPNGEGEYFPSWLLCCDPCTPVAMWYLWVGKVSLRQDKDGEYLLWSLLVSWASNWFALLVLLGTHNNVSGTPVTSGEECALSGLHFLLKDWGLEMPGLGGFLGLLLLSGFS